MPGAGLQEPVISKEYKIKNFTDLDAWQLAHKLCLDVLRLVKEFPNDYRYGLATQMQRSAISVGSNIAEGYGRQHARERVQFYTIARGSLTELRSQIMVCRDLPLITIAKAEELLDVSMQVYRLTNGLIRANAKYINQVN